MAKKLWESVNEYPRKVFGFHCPGCKCAHIYVTARPPGEKGPIWTFNGSLESPTFSPSLLMNGDEKYKNPTTPRCHLFVENGTIKYCGDCEHELRGKTIPMQDIEE